MNKSLKKEKTIYAALALILLVSEILIGKYAHGFVRGSVGDVLVVMLLFSLARIILTRKPKILPILVFAFAVIIEILQYFDFVSLIGMKDNRIVSIALGGTFSFGDIACYAAGTAICFGIDAAVKKIIGK